MGRAEAEHLVKTVATIQPQMDGTCTCVVTVETGDDWDEGREGMWRSSFCRKSRCLVLGRLSFPCLVDLELAIRYISLKFRIKIRVRNANVGGIGRPDGSVG